jgi:class 3 adenylate cyclase/tetratricopeptide (TPR) repeat protein
MAFGSVGEIEAALSREPLITSHELNTIWEQRVKVATSNQPAPVDKSSILKLEWIQSNPSLVTRFTERALRRQQYRLVCDVYDEAAAYWNIPEHRNVRGWLKQMALLARHCAEARARLGFYQRAQNLLAPFSCDLNLVSSDRAEILLQMADIVRKQCLQAPSPTELRSLAAIALDHCQKAFALDSDLFEAKVLSSLMMLASSDADSSLAAQAQEAAQLGLTKTEDALRTEGPSFRSLAVKAYALGVLGRLDEAANAFAQLKDAPDATTLNLAEARYNSQLLAETLNQDGKFFYTAFPPLNLLVFSGHVPDLPGLPPRFPLESVEAVAKMLEEKLRTLGARAAVVSAAAGADLLFIEALRKIPGATYDLVLPWSKEEFVRTSITPFEQAATPGLWRNLFDSAWNNAGNVSELGQLFAPSGDIGWQYTQEVMTGIALLRARMLHLDIKPVVLWDRQPERGAGGTQSFHDLWKQKLDLPPEIIDVPATSTSAHRVEQPYVRTERSTVRQEVKSMFFADIVGYSKLSEKLIADFVDVFLHKLSILLANSPYAPRSLSTWGDAFKGYFDYSHDAALFALQLTQMMRDTHDEFIARGLYFNERDPATGEEVKRPITIRLGLHTGPVVAHFDPVVRRLDYTGSHVVRAARIEPIAEPGEAYASEEFAAMSELNRQISLRNPASEGDASAAGVYTVGGGFVCEYAGSKALAKDYPGLYNIYRVVPDCFFPVEVLAEAAHEEFRATQAHNPNSTPLPPWASLPETYRNANRAQVADIPWKLFELGYELSPSGGLDPHEISMPPDKIERLAIYEHDRWMAERIRNGWTYGKPRDNAKRLHPCLVPWDVLTDEEKEKDRDAVRNMPNLIAKAGFRVRRIRR